MQSYWYLIYTRARQESRAIVNLQRQGFHTYFPFICAKKHIKGEWQTVEEPLFPCYIFVKATAANTAWHPIRSTYGVNKMVSFGDRPALISDHIIGSIVDLVDVHGEQVNDPVFESGQAVRIVGGAMKGLAGIFECYSGKQRAELLVQWLGRENRVCVALDDMVPA